MDNKQTINDQAAAEVIKHIEEAQKKAKEGLKDIQDVKDGKSTVEEEEQEPGFQLYQGICDTVKSIYKNPEFIAELKEFKNIMDNKNAEEVQNTFIELLAFMTSQSIYMSITWYDKLLKNELTKQFDSMVAYMNRLNMDNQALHSVLKVYQTKLNDLINDKKIEDFRKSNNLQ